MWGYRGQSRPEFAEPPGPGQESVWDYPRPPRLGARACRFESRARRHSLTTCHWRSSRPFPPGTNQRGSATMAGGQPPAGLQVYSFRSPGRRMGEELSKRIVVKYDVESKNGEIIQRAITEYRLLQNLSVSGFQDNRGIFGGQLKFRMEFR